MEAIKGDHPVTPTVEFGWGIMKLALCHDLQKRERLEGLLPPAGLAAHGDWFLQRRKQAGALCIFRFLRYLFFCTML